jgi:hypothetical protein
LQLPSANVDVNRDFDGQRFVRHQSSKATWTSGAYDGFEARDTGIGEATNGKASVLVLRPSGDPQPVDIDADAGIVFVFVLQGSMTVRQQGRSAQANAAGDAFVISAGMSVTVADCSHDLELLRVVSK